MWVYNGFPTPGNMLRLFHTEARCLSPLSLLKGFKIDLNCKQLTADFVNQSVLQISSQDVESKRSDKTDFAEQLGAMNKSWQLLQGRVGEKVSKGTHPPDTM